MYKVQLPDTKYSVTKTSNEMQLLVYVPDHFSTLIIRKTGSNRYESKQNKCALVKDST